MKVFPLGYQLTDQDLVFVLELGGVKTDVLSPSVRIYWEEPTGKLTQMTLNNAIIRNPSVGVLWLDAIISNGLTPGNYRITWDFTIPGTSGPTSTTDEFVVVPA